ncbi:LCP family protein [Leucobacter soli]|uniref:Polyisoprenyl-teichoic acid--peptidoglycan teichoic acid transferase TagU n=1 Tax=Leucobacter soli TaxID=2812850 RepID=A0A916JZD7_9MICO|nr:LCP family protein [Leucobacter soli]CAG7617163.1 Polyisoprenyl-teichoic acid--peptidoglycan teichoic acid transferase TagU [Leucobacter soli]
MSIELERPLRNPDTDSAPLMNKRARWLVLLGFVLPGSAQLLAGNRRLGRFGLTATVILLVAAAVSLAGLAWARVFTLSVFTNPIVLLVLQGVIVLYAVLWLILGFDTLRLTRIVRVSPGWRLPVAMLSVLLTVVPVLGAAWTVSTVGTLRGAIGDIFGGGAPAVEPVDGRYNILLLGVDAGADREGLRPDSISLITVDAETGRSAMVGLPRELQQMPFPETSPMHEIHPNGFGVGPNAFGDWGGCLTTCYLNALFAEVETLQDPMYEGFYADAVSRGSSPGIEATKDAVSGATGLTVQFYVLIDMQGFEKLIDALGGVTVTVDERLPIGGDADGNGVEGYIEPGEQHLDGFHALWFARSRYGSATGDYARMERQRELQAAILAQMNPSNVLLRFQEVASAGKSIVETDIPESMLGRFVDLAAKAREFDPVSLNLIPPKVDPEYPRYDEIGKLVRKAVKKASPPEEEEG